MGGGCGWDVRKVDVDIWVCFRVSLERRRGRARGLCIVVSARVREREWRKACLLTRYLAGMSHDGFSLCWKVIDRDGVSSSSGPFLRLDLLCDRSATLRPILLKENNGGSALYAIASAFKSAL
jgi:hypothetical protein